MPEISESVTINRPVMSVFSLVADSNRAKDWQPDVREHHVTDDKLRVGSMLTQRRDTFLLGWRLDLNADIVDYTPNRLIAYKGVLGRFPVQGRIEFESSGGTTQVTESMSIRMGFPFGLFGGFLRGAMGGRTRRALQALKSLAEQAR